MLMTLQAPNPTNTTTNNPQQTLHPAKKSRGWERREQISRMAHSHTHTTNAALYHSRHLTRRYLRSCATSHEEDHKFIVSYRTVQPERGTVPCRTESARLCCAGSAVKGRKGRRVRWGGKPKKTLALARRAYIYLFFFFLPFIFDLPSIPFYLIAQLPAGTHVVWYEFSRYHNCGSQDRLFSFFFFF
ncbi:hypothetical protein HOY82DRAFT_326481 [Tuber indicum]|nr:hypothetical protein HOY82DRAFT_326481 [Tuber indicum]